MSIGYKERNFKKYLENHFGIVPPPEISIFYAKGVRVGNRDILKSNIHGELGYAACDFGFNPTNALIQNFGYLAKKNVVVLDAEQAKKFAAGEAINLCLEGKSRYLIIRYKVHTLGLGFYNREKKIIENRIPKKRRRRIINQL